jgi:hypothetical protein
MSESVKTILRDRTEWTNAAGEKHRLDGPAIEWLNGGKAWYVNGKLHRLDGPAYEAWGDKAWYVNGKKHRLDGPAIESAEGSKAWYVDDKLHRLDGPAIEDDVNGNEWWVYGRSIIQRHLSDFKEITSVIKRSL